MVKLSMNFSSSCSLTARTSSFNFEGALVPSSGPTVNSVWFVPSMVMVMMQFSLVSSSTIFTMPASWILLTVSPCPGLISLSKFVVWGKSFLETLK